MGEGLVAKPTQKTTRLRRWHILIVFLVWLGWLTLYGFGLSVRCYENGGYEDPQERAFECNDFFTWDAPMRGLEWRWPMDQRGHLLMWLIWAAMAIGAAAFILVRTHRRPKK